VKQHIDIKIESPCSERWESFEKRTANIGYCQSCQKEVINFTRMSDEEIRKYFLNANGRVCGMLRLDQQKTYYDYSVRNFSWRLPVLLMGFGTALFGNSVALNAQETKIEKTVLKPALKIEKSNPDSFEIRGKVVDSNGEDLPGVNVMIKGTTTGVTTTLDGTFSITVPSQNAVLVFSSVGMPTIEEVVGDRRELRLEMAPDPRALDEMVITGGVCGVRWYTPRGLWFKVRGFVYNITHW
jgi:hypothetical protein